MTTPVTLTVEKLSRSHPASRRGAGRVVALHPVSLTVEPGRPLAILGPSGSGKSTLLRLIAGLDPPDSGTISVTPEGGRPLRLDALPPHRRGVGLLTQRPALYPDQTVAANLGLRAGELTEAAKLLDLEPFLARLPEQLSGGEAQRVALARLVALAPPVWLLDEPLSGLDPVRRADFRADLHLLAARSRATMVVVTHDPADAWALGYRVGVLEAGRLEQLGTPSEMRADPHTAFAAASFAGASLLPGVVSESGAFVADCGGLTLPTPPAAAGTRLTLGVRPGDIWAAGTEPDRIPAARLVGWSAAWVEPWGGDWVVTLRHGAGRETLRAGWRGVDPPPVGVSADWRLDTATPLWFDTAGRRPPTP